MRKMVWLAVMAASAALAQVQYATWDGTRQKVDERLLKAFTEATGIQVAYNLVPWGTYWQKASAMVAGGSTFDVMWMNLDNFPFYASQRALSPIPLSQEARGLLPKGALDLYTVRGQVLGLPLGPQVVTVYINRKLFQERGVPIPKDTWTFEEMREAARKLTFTRSDGKKVWGINAMDLQIDSEYGMAFYYSNGGTGIIRRVGDRYEANLDEAFRDTAKKLLDLIYVDKVSPGPQDSTLQGYQLFQAGQMGIYVLGSWMTEVWKGSPELDWAFAPLPVMKKGLEPVGVYSVHALVVPAASRNKEGAYRLAEWYTTSAQAQRIVAGAGLMPTLADRYRSTYLQALPGRNGEVVFRQLPRMVVRHADVRNLSNLPEVLDALYNAMNLAWTGNLPLDKALDKARADMNALLRNSKPLW
ncbi:ABC transporter substrate-binding protein [Thermus tengchongensis]|uniref:Sugar ABC transporter substrate-binding protein n=1 Tax=Thermus tengchongensis TaxID=1214928 RepID=A0A4Y9F7V3_9DEIN|nr:sugar ABC transporter substrate-binding protein [Thermus tengchongensis]TFU25145.1 sugar ABC transporter substrate-binding protein [Thermus tengchongensis]